MSTESTSNDEFFIIVGAFFVDSVDVESHSSLTQLTWVDSVDEESHSASTQCAEDESSQNRQT